MKILIQLTPGSTLNNGILDPTHIAKIYENDPQIDIFNRYF